MIGGAPNRFRWAGRGPGRLRQTRAAEHPIIGTCRPGFEPVREAFAASFAQRGELGAGVCVIVVMNDVIPRWRSTRNRALVAAVHASRCSTFRLGRREGVASNLRLPFRTSWKDHLL